MASIPLKLQHPSPVEFGGWQKCCGGASMTSWCIDNPKLAHSCAPSTWQRTALVCSLLKMICGNTLFCFGIFRSWVWEATSTSLKLKPIYHSDDNSEFYMILYILKRINTNPASHKILCGLCSSLMWMFNAAHSAASVQFLCIVKWNNPQVTKFKIYH